MNNSMCFGDDRAIAPKNINEAHMQVVLICDISGSMAGTPIEKLNLAINRFAKDICKDEKAAAAVEVLVIAFNDKAKVVEDWRPITDFKEIKLSAGGNTDITAGLELAIEKTRERTAISENLGIELKKPYYIIITDGYGGDVSEIAKTIKQRTADGKMLLFFLGVPEHDGMPGYDKKTAALLTEGRRVFELVEGVGFDFTDFFDFMAVSVKKASVKTPDELIHISDEDNPLKKKNPKIQVPDLDDWLNK